MWQKTSGFLEKSRFPYILAIIVITFNYGRDPQLLMFKEKTVAHAPDRKVVKIRLDRRDSRATTAGKSSPKVKVKKGA